MALEHESDSALAEGVRIAGSQSAFARMINRPQQTVHDWLKENKPLPAEHVLVAERGTGIARWRYRPDLYPEPTASSAEQRSAGGAMEPAR